MKYLILVIISLFCLTSYSEHKKDPMTEEDETRFRELRKKHFAHHKLNDPVHEHKFVDEEHEEYHKLNDKSITQTGDIYTHFHPYLRFEYRLIKSEEGFESAQRSAIISYVESHFSVDSISKIPDCTKELLEKKQCPKPPYFAIFLSKRLFESGKCYSFTYVDLHQLLDGTVIPKTDMGESESYFHFLNYVASVIYANVYDALMASSWKKEQAQLTEQKLLQNGFFTQEEIEKRAERIKKSEEESARKRRDKSKKLREKLSQKQRKAADQKINELIKKWTKKYGKDKIYHCKADAYYDQKSKIEFLNKYYPYLD